MRASTTYRIVAVLLVLHTAGHTIGFSHVDAAWGVDAPIAALKSIHFTAGGTADRTYWGFYMGFGYFCSILLSFSAVLAWQLALLSPAKLRDLQFVSWAFAGAFVLATCVTWIYFFVAPVVFDSLIAVGLIAGAWRARTEGSG